VINSSSSFVNMASLYYMLKSGVLGDTKLASSGGTRYSFCCVDVIEWYWGSTAAELLYHVM